MKLDKYIRQLLLENETVIIPGFGAFISNYKPAEINEETNEITPPSKTVIFNQKIRNNDGLLVGVVAESEGISHFDALKSIERERENIIYRLDKGEKVTLEKTGILFVDDDRIIQLDAFESENLLLDSFGLEATSLEIPKVEEKEIEAEKEETNDEEAKEPEEVVNETPEETAAPIAEEKKEFEEENVDEKIEESVTESEPEKLLLTEKEPEEKFVYPKEPMPEENKKKRKGLWFLLMLIPIIVAGYYVTQVKQKKNIETFDDLKTIPQPELSKEVISAADSAKQDSILISDADSTFVEEPKVDSSEIIDPNLPVYILVGGSFKAEENAETYFQQLKAEGFEPFHLGKRGNFFIVGIGKYNSEKEALDAKAEILEKSPGSGIWVKKE